MVKMGSVMVFLLFRFNRRGPCIRSPDTGAIPRMTPRTAKPA